MIAEFMENFCTAAETNCRLDYTISLKELKAEGGIYAEAGEGFGQTKTYGKDITMTLPVLLLIRDADQLACIRNLESICRYFDKLKKYPSGKTYKWLDADISKPVNKIARDADGTYHYSCIINCLLYTY